ncbi:MAG: YchJ family metal-binding protein [Nitrospinales bacterium]
MKDCPCGTGFPYTDCCGPLIRGVGFSDTAEELMRSRFTAFAKGQWDYLEQTRYPGDGELEDGRYSNLTHDGISWKKLEIFDVRKGGAFDESGEVSFVACYTENGEEKKLHETSKFIKENGRWYYSERQSKIAAPDPAPPAKPFVRNQPKVGRNDPCPCGSGKKFKKCCGK